MQVIPIYKAIVTVSLFTVLGTTLIGCGSKSGAVGVATSIRSDVITRANENSFSLDAKILSARESTDGWISSVAASQIDSDLTKIRANSPAVTAIHALPTDDPNSILVDLPKTASWWGKWQAGTVTTGISAIDALSLSYKVSGVATSSLNTDSTVFKLTFTDPLATRLVASAYKKADSAIRDAYANATVGDGDNIARNISGGTRVYQLSKGWGDCTAGCTKRHIWQFTLSPDNSITVTESGVPLP